MPTGEQLSNVLRNHSEDILAEWMRLQMSADARRPDLISEADLRRQSSELLSRLRQAAEAGRVENLGSPEWKPVIEMLKEVSHSRARQGFTPTETAMFVFSLKQPLYGQLRQAAREDAGMLLDEVLAANKLLDALGMVTIETFQKGREDVIRRQQQELLELSTPVVQLWRGVLALPLIGTLDSARTQVVMESLLQEIMNTGSTIAIIDITGVPAVDTLVAQHLLKTVAAARLMGADCIISGIRPQIAQTIVHLGVDLGTVATKASLADAFRMALNRIGMQVTPVRDDQG
jgi:rsbT co-antagonist protein RsbR